jgi:hypothetical protein
MIKFVKKPIDQMGFDFVAPEFLPTGKNEYHLRETDITKSYRPLSNQEIEILEKNANIADDWKNVQVCDGFNPNQVKRTRFKGGIRIGKLENYFLEYHDLKLPVGIYDSTIVSCDLGDNVVVNYVSYMAHYQVEDEVVLFNIKELITTAVAKFGNGILKQGEDPSSRISLELGNENGGRAVFPFDGIWSSDVYLWYKYRDDKVLMHKLTSFTDQKFDDLRGHYGKIGKQTIIKNSLIIKDVTIGTAAYIKGANKLKNLTIHSNPSARTQIGEGVELVNGIIGLGCRIFYGSKAVRFVMGQASQLKYGARLINSFLGANATISCCEVLNSLIYPFHEQHHNNSFLCAATVLGQSNLAAGATIGSNHNSRAADGEIIAGRGFWPGLCVSFKHNSKFASFTLVAKGDFPAEIDLKIPFALVSNNNSENCLDIMPAYWFMYNMYALARNSWKYQSRDKRQDKYLSIELDYLAPDSINEIIEALSLIEIAVGESYHKLHPLNEENTQAQGKKLLNDHPELVDGLEILLHKAENSKRKVRLSKVSKAYNYYKKFIIWNGIKSLISSHPSQKNLTQLIKDNYLNNQLEPVVNLGGQLVTKAWENDLKSRIKTSKINNWDEVHQAMIAAQDNYPGFKTAHSVAAMLTVFDVKAAQIKPEITKELIEIAQSTQRHIAQNTHDSRAKDYQNHFRKMIYDNQAEMDEVIGKLEENDFIALIQKESDLFITQLNGMV